MFLCLIKNLFNAARICTDCAALRLEARFTGLATMSAYTWIDFRAQMTPEQQTPFLVNRPLQHQ